jgi:glucose/arabinose dehydrogenase
MERASRSAPRARRLGGAALAIACAAAAAHAGPLPRAGERFVNAIRAGCTETVIVDSLDSPVSMAFAPDGRVFVCEQAGRLRVVRNGKLLAKPFVAVPTKAIEEEGLLAVAFDPAFARTRHVYVTYTSYTPTRHNVIAHFTASGDTALAGSERIVYEFDTHDAHQHVGGALRFGRDGMLYATSGEVGDGAHSHSLASTAGKVLRIRPDGSIPGDNPFPTLTRGRYGAIWARGFRNAFALDVHPGSGRMFVNDVGGSIAEEVNELKRGADYGWPISEGLSSNSGLTNPLHAYRHGDGCAITGGTFYAPARPSLGAEWRDGYFFSEYCANEIRWLSPARPPRMVRFGHTRVPGPVDLRVAPDGSLWYLARGNTIPTGGAGSAWGMVVRIARATAAHPRR